MKAIISGGGSGGHIFPAIAIANAIKKRWPDADLLFVGAEGRMEMEKVPAAGYAIEGLPIAGLQRKITIANIIKNIQLPLRMIRSNRKVRGILRQFCPDVVIGVGGFASQPTLKAAEKMGLPTVIQEQNSYAGLTNKMLAEKARVICVAYEGMDRFFSADRIVLTGNPVRSDIEHLRVSREESCLAFGLDTSEQVLLSVGGSLGARSINQMILDNIDFFRQNNIQLLWQTGRHMYEQAVAAVKKADASRHIKVHQFITRMDMAYAAADVVISRAGAIAISELCLVGKPVILIPSPNVAEDHQTKNAMALVSRGAAKMVKDSDCSRLGLSLAKNIFEHPETMQQMSQAIRQMGVEGAAEKIVDQVELVITRNNQ